MRTKDLLWRFYLAAVRQGSGFAEEIRRVNGKAVVVQDDVTRAELVKTGRQASQIRTGQVTLLAYNASVYGRGAFLALDPKIVERSFDMGVMGAVYFGQAIIPDMLKAGHGFISLTGAISALRRRAGFARPWGNRQGFGADARSISGPRISPERIHVVDVIMDGQIDTPQTSGSRPKPGY